MPRKRPEQLSLNHLSTFIKVAEQGSFSEAALLLGMSQSAVSSAIATLESDLGISLFLRGRHGATLTSVGERMLAHAQRMTAIQEEMVRDANLARSLKGGEIRIAAFRSIAAQILPEILAQFQQRFPDIRVDLKEKSGNAALVDDLRKGKVDVAFVDDALSDDFETWTFVRDEFVVLLPSDAVIDLPLTWETLAQYPMIMATEDCDCDRLVYRHCETYGYTLKVAYHVQNDSTIVGMVARGLGGTIIPRLAAEPIPTNITILSLPVPLFRSIDVAILAKALQPPAVFAFLELLKESRG
ncbi:MAG: LysR family transcriptional regulator [Leptolyngbyaceae bacterium]|nr:LysR family transcriptional regulator [Leptolyngbyaceae bacterium]